jgi:hypothetical protein
MMVRRFVQLIGIFLILAIPGFARESHIETTWAQLPSLVLGKTLAVPVK